MPPMMYGTSPPPMSCGKSGRLGRYQYKKSELPTMSMSAIATMFNSVRPCRKWRTSSPPIVLLRNRAPMNRLLQTTGQPKVVCVTMAADVSHIEMAPEEAVTVRQHQAMFRMTGRLCRSAPDPDGCSCSESDSCAKWRLGSATSTVIPRRITYRTAKNHPGDVRLSTCRDPICRSTFDNPAASTGPMPMPKKAQLFRLAIVAVLNWRCEH
mmetsp:Transcript_16058/g.51249  ORF Transcript_16058/g.51249 Transcript_16058/m.51249 type:complete len:210 (-) Transcript_16058:589-1218(-)